MVECGGFENRYRRKTIGGSNPPLSVVSTLSDKPSNPKGRWFIATSRKETTALARLRPSQSLYDKPSSECSVRHAAKIFHLAAIFGIIE